MAADSYVLLAEDNPDDLALIRLAFETEGFPFELKVARDGEEALGLLAGAGRLPALVVLDVKMPKVSGLGVLAAIREDARLKNLPAVMLTTSDEPRDRERAQALGVRLYLKKPMTFEGLREVVGRLRALLE